LSLFVSLFLIAFLSLCDSFSESEHKQSNQSSTPQELQ
jgi:hypothetical protein